MNFRRSIQNGAVLLALLGLLTPAPLRAANPLRASGISDVALADGGVLHGQLLDQQGSARAGVGVHCVSSGQVIGQTRTDAAGRFQFSGLKGGVVQIQSPLGGGVYRCWAHRTAPPSARNAVLIVQDGTVQRGQHGANLLNILSNPWVLTTLAALAIILPLTLDNKKDAS